MVVSKEMSCPFCKKSLPFDFGFEHDMDLNFICSHCKKVIFGTTEETEKAVKDHVGLTGAQHSHMSCMGFGGTIWKKEAIPISLVNEVPPLQEVKEADVADRDNVEEYACFC